MAFRYQVEAFASRAKFGKRSASTDLSAFISVGVGSSSKIISTTGAGSDAFWPGGGGGLVAGEDDVAHGRAEQQQRPARRSGATPRMETNERRPAKRA